MGNSLIPRDQYHRGITINIGYCYQQSFKSICDCIRM